MSKFRVKMKIENIDISDSISNVKTLLNKDKKISPSLKAAIEVLILLITILVSRLSLNSSNSSKSPSSDPNRKRKKKKNSENKRGGQNGHRGYKLKKVANPDKIKTIKINRKSLPKGKYIKVGYETRQIIDIQIKRIITEYRAEILENEKGKRFVATFPENIKYDVQYGNSIKANSVYMSQFQLVPYNRIQDYFMDQIGVPISMGSIYNFNQEAYDLLEKFDEISRRKLLNSKVLHADETGINIDGKRKWLHLVSSDLWTYYYPHEKRGSIAMNEIGIIPKFLGILCHDHWKSYYNYSCKHALCNAHHLRELQAVIELENHKWALKMKEFLIEANKKNEEKQGNLSFEEIDAYKMKYENILEEANIECPEPIPIKGKRGRPKKTKARNLLERFINYKEDVLRFINNKLVPFTNNQAENDLRMVKVQQKISGCFRSENGAKMFCRIKSYLSTCRKHGIKPTDAIKSLFENRLPDFINDA